MIKTCLKLLPVLAIALVTGVIGSMAGTLARSDATLMHITVRTQDSRGAVVRSEYWVDDERALVKVIDTTREGTAIHATGPDWALDIPATGDRAYLYRVQVPGTGPTQSIRGRLFYYRDVWTRGAATVVSRENGTVVVRTEDGSNGAFDASNGFTLWESRAGVRTAHQHAAEIVSSQAFPLSFFSDTGGRKVARRTETTLPEAAAGAKFPFRSIGDSTVGRSVTRVLVTEGDSDRTLQQVNVLYGSDIEVVQSLLAAPTILARSGGRPITTTLGTGAVFYDESGVTIVVISGAVATSVFAPAEDTALTVLSKLSGS